ncbi:MAG: LiaF domain-containing protein [Flavitalea sp.]
MTEENTPAEVPRRRPRGNSWVGLLFLLVGGGLLLRQMGYAFPSWLFRWEMILILVGLFIGIKHKFQDLTWVILVVVGMVFLSEDIWPGISIQQYAWPIGIIAVGLAILLSPRRIYKFKNKDARKDGLEEKANPFSFGPYQEPELDIVSIFGSIKKRALSKDFRGGEIVCIFGGSEINLSSADFISPIVIDVTQIFGGTTLIVPANWEVRSEIAAIFGGIDDKRPQAGNVHPEKVLILKGTSIFGGIEIKSY